ncbi:MAG: SUF system NifU family Fe-S cluster assembly protein [Lactobacillus equicursoris]|uniref:Fe-S cluster assembly sulfur transfer protein SufU n=1 Tax=Lactobacillus equicursoris TaxID=420645 RepID=UPI002430351A|nr:SUF system NifU family Fe-S cluster assembly protein [Lactobacillus equicursoris]MDD6406504.1 SUF system NifU family Fe-S cluster assembly protein [Lactobacillus equicursoris]
MGLDKLSQLYRTILLDYAAHPKYAQPLEILDQEVRLINHSCGDQVTLQVKFADDEGSETTKIDHIACLASGCTIFQASSAIMTEQVLGKKLSDVMKMKETFYQMLEGQDLAADNKKKLGDATLLAGVSQFPARIKCAALPWQAVAEAIERKQEGK